MCAAKLERTGFVLRNVWPNFKHFAGEQSTSLAHSSSESGFVRKNSQKAEAAAGAKHVQRRYHANRSRMVPRQLSGWLSSSGARHFVAAATGARPEVSSLSLQPGVVPQPSSEVLKSGHRKDQALRSGVSIDELIKNAADKYELNEAFWGRYADIPSMALASEKEDILQIIENFALIHRKHIYLFQRLKSTVLRTLDMWSASDFAVLCHAWAQLGFLHEDLCVGMADRVQATAYACTCQELCWLMDAYATARCSVDSVVNEITRQTLLRLEEFTPSQLCLHASSFARLNIRNAQLFSSIADMLEQVPLCVEDSVLGQTPALSARDLTLAAYSFAKLGFHTPRIFETVARSALPVIRDFTARDLQMLTVALVRVQHKDAELLEALSIQAQRRIAQFNSESLALLLRGMAFFGRSRDPLFTRAVAQLPRAILTFRPGDVTALLSAFAAARVHSPALFDVVTPFILEKAGVFTASDWLLVLQSYSSLGHRDSTFLSALALHLEASKLSFPQLSSALADCSRLSFTGATSALAEAAHTKLTLGGGMCSADVVAQMYTALLLLGSETPGSAGLLMALAEHLNSGAVELSPASCVDLCFASLLAPPVDGGGRHPVDTLQLVERCTRDIQELSREGQLLLGLIAQGLEQLLPWNNKALRYAEQIQSLNLRADSEAESSESLSEGCWIAAAGHLVPRAGGQAGRTSPSEVESLAEPGGLGGLPAESGVFLAAEIRDALSNVSAALAARGIEHNLVLDGPTEAHILLSRSSFLSELERASGTGLDDKLVLLWGSSVHFLSNSEEDSTNSALSLASKLQVAALQAAYGAKVLVLPHWRLPCLTRATGSSIDDLFRVLKELCRPAIK
mmetsp:Transcript_81208/g.143201  ORF Transcript_81208/g.143201 Transcript_81208/m.143201 type:complete len:856 (-) Transcript_81208:127-2694(-)